MGSCWRRVEGVRTSTKNLDTMTKVRLQYITVFIRISAQPLISAHLEEAPILKAEKVNKRPPLPPPNQTQISAHPHPTHLSE